MTIASTVDIQARHLLITTRLRQRRDDLGLTQKQVVTRLGRCGLRTTNRALSSLEHGTGLDVAKLPELAAALDCTVTYLVGLTDDPHNWEPDDEVIVPSRRAQAPISSNGHGPAANGHGPAANQHSPAANQLSPAANGHGAAGVREPVTAPVTLILGDEIPGRRFGRL
ncbi:MAG: helix-turn-helix transcriptional regulator [Actinomycetota bacterium]|nr:helix-turn-helix transcriptional regulator [Actinomycetota bacterium]